MGKFTENHKKAVSIVSVIIFIIFSAVILWFIGRPMLQLANDRVAFRNWINSYGILGKIIFIGMIILQIIVAIIPGEPLELGGGYAFGAIWGTVLTLIGVAIGSILVFLLVKKFGVKLVEAFFSVEKINSMKFLQDSKHRDTIFFIVMVIPGTPKDLLTYIAGITNMKLTTWLIIATLGRIPSIITSTFGGAAVANGNYVLAAIIFAATILISGIGFFIYMKISAKKR